MEADDAAATALGCVVERAGAGHAVVTMRVRDDMTNGLDVCHGGLIFTLADTAMAHASNGHGEPAFAVAASIDFVVPGRRGTVLRAEARETFRRGRTALYDVEVTDDQATLVARFHGRTQHPTR